MVLITWAGLAVQVATLASAKPLANRASQQYLSEGRDGVRALQGWYDASSGLWSTTGWWNSANCITVLADFAAADPTDSNTLSIASIISNTYNQAQGTSAMVTKKISAEGLYHSSFAVASTVEKRSELAARGFKNFLNDYYDDEGWWALAFIRAYDVYKTRAYLSMAQTILADMQGGGDSTCGGGIWWSKDRNYKNAIANELYLAVLASLANRVPSQKRDLTAKAVAQWNWFKASGMINGNNLINDGLTINSDGSCTNNGQQTWTYNQGVILGALIELAKATGDNSYLTQAKTIATAALKSLSDGNGVLHESCEPNCGGDGNQFKGIFMRNLHYLQLAAPDDMFKKSITTNADSIWATDRNGNNQLGITWTGPVSAGGGPNASTHSSAMDAMVAAVAVT